MQSKQGLVNILSIIGIILVIAFISYIFQIYGLDRLKENLDKMGNLTPAAIFLLRSTSIIIPAFPSTPYSIIAGALLGFKQGLITICIADLVSCSMSYFLAKHFGREVVRRLVSDRFIEKVEKFSTKHIENNFFLITGSLMTGLFDFVSYGIGLTKTRWSKYLPALIIAVIISNIPIVALGAGIFSKGKQILVLALIGCFALAIIAGRINSKNRKYNHRV